MDRQIDRQIDVQINSFIDGQTKNKKGKREKRKREKEKQRKRKKEKYRLLEKKKKKGITNVLPPASLTYLVHSFLKINIQQCIVIEKKLKSKLNKKKKEGEKRETVIQIRKLIE